MQDQGALGRLRPLPYAPPLGRATVPHPRKPGGHGAPQGNARLLDRDVRQEGDAEHEEQAGDDE